MSLFLTFSCCFYFDFVVVLAHALLLLLLAQFFSPSSLAAASVEPFGRPTQTEVFCDSTRMARVVFFFDLSSLALASASAADALLVLALLRFWEALLASATAADGLLDVLEVVVLPDAVVLTLYSSQLKLLILVVLLNDNNPFFNSFFSDLTA